MLQQILRAAGSADVATPTGGLAAVSEYTLAFDVPEDDMVVMFEFQATLKTVTGDLTFGLQLDGEITDPGALGTSVTLAAGDVFLFRHAQTLTKGTHTVALLMNDAGAAGAFDGAQVGRLSVIALSSTRTLGQGVNAKDKLAI